MHPYIYSFQYFMLIVPNLDMFTWAKGYLIQWGFHFLLQSLSLSYTHITVSLAHLDIEALTKHNTVCRWIWLYSVQAEDRFTYCSGLLHLLFHKTSPNSLSLAICIKNKQTKTKFNQGKVTLWSDLSTCFVQYLSIIMKIRDSCMVCCLVSVPVWWKTLLSWQASSNLKI